MRLRFKSADRVKLALPDVGGLVQALGSRVNRREEAEEPGGLPDETWVSCDQTCTEALSPAPLALGPLDCRSGGFSASATTRGNSTHTHTYIRVCTCVCVLLALFLWRSPTPSNNIIVSFVSVGHSTNTQWDQHLKPGKK